MATGGASSAAQKRLIDDAPDCSTQSSKKRILTNRQKAEKICRDTLDDLDPSITHETIGPNGNFLIDELEQDLAKKGKVKGFTMGKGYYDDKRRIFKAAAQAQATRRAAVVQAEIDAELLSAMVQWKKKPMNRGPLIAWAMKQKASPPSKEVGGICKALGFLNPSPSQADHLQDGMRLLTKVCDWGGKQTYAQACAENGPTINRFMLQAFIMAARGGTKPAPFIKTHRKILDLIFDMKNVDAIASAQDDWANCSAELGASCESPLGKKLFGFAMKGLDQAKLQKRIDAELEKLFVDNYDISLETVNTFIADTYQELSKLELHHLPQRRKQKVMYRGVVYEMRTAHAMTDLLQSVWASINGRAVEMGALIPVGCENDLVVSNYYEVVDKKKGTFHAEVLAKAAVARAKANLVIDALEVKNSDTILQALGSKLSSLMSDDSEWKVTHAFFVSMAGDDGTKHLQRVVKQKLPKEDCQKVDLAKLHTELVAVKNSKLYQFCTPSAQRSVDAAVGAVGTLKSGISPAFSEKSSHWMLQVADSLAYTLTDQSCRGMDAYRQVLQRVRDSLPHAKPADIDILYQYHWLSPISIDEIDKLVATKGNGYDTKAQASAAAFCASSSSSSSSSSKGPSKEQMDELAGALSMFG